MNTQITPGDSDSFRTTAGAFPRATSTLIASCGLVATAAYLGASWLHEPMLGLPTGIWLIAIAQGAAFAIWQRQDRASSRTHRIASGALQPALASIPASSSASSSLPPSAGAAPFHRGPSAPSAAAVLGLDLVPPLAHLAAAGCELAKAAARGLHVSTERIAEVEDHIGAWLDRQHVLTRPLRIGLDLEAELAGILRESELASAAPVEWITIPAGMDDVADLSRHRLDALVRKHKGDLRIVTLENDQRDAAWYDWSTPRPLSYASVFPLRCDPAQITVGEIPAGDLKQVGLIARLAQIAAALSRTPGRLTLPDRMFGRRTLIGTQIAGGRQGPSPAEVCIRELAASIAEWGAAEPCAARQAAARAVSAWAATSEAWIDTGFRRRTVEAAAEMLTAEPEVSLRLAAVRFADGDEKAGHEALRNADELIRRQGHEQIVDHVAFLESELHMGTPGPMTLGRVAAGICLVCATSPAERLAYIRGDLLDDIRYSSWLVGRDQNRAMLMEVFAMLEAVSQEKLADGESRRAA